MKQESKNKNFFYNYYYILNNEQSPFENKECFLFPNTLFKSFKNNFSKASTSIQTNEVPKSELIINNEVIMNDTNFDVNEKNKNKNNNKVSSSDTTKDITIEIHNIEENNKFLSKKRYFNIDTKKKKGRKTNSLIIRSCHTKFSHDNILRKIKVKFFHKLINYINSIILSKYRNRINVLKNLKGEISQNNTINFNKQLLNSKLKDIFSNFKINGKFKLFESFYNKEIIEKIYKENIQELIEILEITFLDAFNVFRDTNETQKLIGLEKVNTVIEEIKLKENDEEYINKFRDIVMNFENYYLNKEQKK